MNFIEDEDEDEYDWLDFNESKIIKNIKIIKNKEYEKYRRDVFEYCKYGGYISLRNLLSVLTLEFDRKIVSKIINTLFNGTRAIFVCIENRNLSCLELLIKYGADLKLKNGRNNILHFSCLKNYIEFINYILDNNMINIKVKKYIINEKNYNGLTPLQIYTSKNEYDFDNMIKKFIENGANINLSEQIKSKNTDKLVRNIIKDKFEKDLSNNELCIDMIDIIIGYIR